MKERKTSIQGRIRTKNSGRGRAGTKRILLNQNQLNNNFNLEIKYKYAISDRHILQENI